MKKIINGKVYDSDKATGIGSWDNGCGYNDFNYVSETLYRKRTGEYFILGGGGAMTKYAVSTGNNSWGGSTKIIPLTYDAANKWAMDHLSANEYEKEFGEIVEDDNSETITVSIPASSAAKLRRMAQQKEISISSLIASFTEN